VPPRLTVIIPTLNEAPNLPRAIASAFAAGADEVVVSDGGSTDGTVAIAESLGVTVLQGARGRGPQLNLGASRATGQIYCFLHADARLHPASGQAMEEVLRDPAVVGGNFRIRFGADAHGRFLAALYHVIRQLRVYYGDSAIFCRSESFDAVGGFPPIALMEDLAFVHQLHRRGRMAYLAPPVSASPRRWEHGGIAQAWASWLVIQGGYFLHVPPERLARLYRQIR
jgi:rSAM/selenodomain-associated transferase 2